MDPGTIAAIQRIISAISKADRNSESRPSASDVEAVATTVAADPAVVQRLHAALGEPAEDTGQFLKLICEIEPALGFSRHSSIIAGHILAHAMASMSHQEKSDVLSVVVADQIRFFPLLRCLLPVFAHVALEASYVIRWLLAAYERIRTDLAQGSFWQCIDQWALHDPVQAVRGLRLITGMDDLNDAKIAIAATILGNLRVAWERGPVDETGNMFAETLLTSGDVNLRLVYHRSWINTGLTRGLSVEEFLTALRRMGDGTVQEREEAFNFLRCLLAAEKINPASREAGLVWLRSRVQPSTSDQAKHWVVTIVHKLFPRQLKDRQELKRLWDLLIAAQPINPELAGTWQEIEHLLVDLVVADHEEFKRLLHLLLHANEAAIRHHFGSVNTFQYLYSELSRLNLQDFYAEMFFSTARVERGLAFAMFDRMPFDHFPEGMLASKNDNEIALCLFESRLHHLDAVQVSTLFVMLAERAQPGAKPLTDLFRNELLYQAKNYPGAVLERISKIESPNPLVASVVSDANRYFDRLERTHGSAIKAMQIPGWRRAAFRQNARQRREIDDKSDQSSSLFGLFHKSYLLYGSDGFRYSRDGDVGELAKMQTLSTEMQLPRMLMIDPEGNALRRRESIHATKLLSAKISENTTSDA